MEKQRPKNFTNFIRKDKYFMKNVLAEQVITNFKKSLGVDKEKAREQGIKGEDRHAFVQRSGKRVTIVPRIHEEYMPEIIINDIDVFERNLKKYLDAIKYTDIKSTTLDDRHTDRYFLFNIWKNATASDFQNPEKFILRYTNFIKDQTFSEFDELTPIGNFAGNMVMAQRCQDDYGFETPYIMHLSLTDGKHIYNLPWIRYGITQNRFGEKLAYIYGIQRMETSSDEEYGAKMQKAINGVNTGVKEYRNEVTPSFIASLGIFMGMLEGAGIKSIKAPDFLVGRYGRYSNAKTEEETDRIQYNLTEKFFRNFSRLDSQLDNFKVEPIDISEFNSFLCMSLDKFKGCKNETLAQLYEIGRIAVEKRKDGKEDDSRDSRKRKGFEDTVK